MEKDFNNKRNDIGEAMEQALRDNEHDEIIPLINLGTPFSLLICIVFFLHYAPKGVKQVTDQTYNFCRTTQCCVHTMFSKLLNYMINEYIYGKDKMEEWSFGGRTDVDESPRMAVVDLMPVLLDKEESDSKMRAQYEHLASCFGVETFWMLMIIPYCILQMHILLFKASGQRCKLQIHVASAATAKYIFGFAQGLQKYLTRFIADSFVISFGLHPQAYLMGICKNVKVYHQYVRGYMMETLRLVYSNVYEFADDYRTFIMDVFGADYAGIDIGMYSHIARLLDAADLLNLDKDYTPSLAVSDTDYVTNIIQSVTGMSQSLTDFIILW